jgi:surfeit locus 1 family protein
LKVKNKSLLLDILFVVIFLILLRLGFWQLDRADQKNEINQNYLERQSSLEVFDETDINEENLWGKFSIEGEFTTSPNLYLDNQTYKREAGYVIYSPFLTRENKVILVNRGWHDLIEDRNELPAVKKIIDTMISGILTKVPSHGIILNTENIENINDSSIRIQRIDLGEIKEALNIQYEIYPFVLTLEPPIDENLKRHLILPVSNSEKNYGYAFQWFAFALTLLIIFITLRIKNK